VLAVGGDGTVSAVASGLIGSEVPLGIVPAGTANILADELNIPLDVEQACQLLASRHRTVHLDAMWVGQHPYFTHVGVGLDALVMQDTRPDTKRRFGRMAYVLTATVLDWCR